MIKAVQTLGIAIVAALSLTGCELYFGNSDNGGSGVHNPPGQGGSGFQCASNADCAAGCDCQDGVCVETGFCTTSADCPPGDHCDDRSTCVPNSCDDSTPCPSGSVCTDGTCTITCTCGSDAEAQRQGFDRCDEATQTCVNGADPAGACNDAVTCNEKPPTCDEHTVPLVKDGCYTGECRAIAQCEGPPACSAFQYQDDCEAPGDCTVVTTGHNCTKMDGTACNPGDSGCTCQSFTFAACM